MGQFVRKGTTAAAPAAAPVEPETVEQGEVLDLEIGAEGTAELAVVGKENQLEISKVEALLGQFTEPFLEARQLAVGYDKLVVTDENDKAGMDKARKHRLAIRQVRINAENIRKTLKEASLREGKAIDGMANIIKAIIVPAEQHYEQQEKFAETLATERKATRKAERTHELSQYMDNVFIFNLEEMDDDAYAQVLEDAKAKHAAKIAAEKAAADAKAAQEKAEAEAAEERRKKQAADLKKAQADAKKAAEEKAAADKVAADEKARADAAEAALKAEEQKKADEAAAAEKAAQDALKAPDKDKLRALYVDIAKITEAMPELQSEDAQRIAAHAKDLLKNACQFIAAEAKKL